MDWHGRLDYSTPQYIPSRDQSGYIGSQNKNPNLGHYAHYVPTCAAATTNDRQMPASVYSGGVVPKTDPSGIAARFVLEPDGSVQPSYAEPPCITCQAPLNPSTWR